MSFWILHRNSYGLASLNLSEPVDKAAQALENLLPAQEKVCGAEDLEYLRSLYELAGMRRKQLRFEDSEEILQEALAMREKFLGTDHLVIVNAVASFHRQLSMPWETRRG